jgi:hypothetical protein
MSFTSSGQLSGWRINTIQGSCNKLISNGEALRVIPLQITAAHEDIGVLKYTVFKKYLSHLALSLISLLIERNRACDITKLVCVLCGEKLIRSPIHSFTRIWVRYYFLFTTWPESASEIYRPSYRRLSAKLVPTFTDRGCHVVSVTDPEAVFSVLQTAAAAFSFK